MVEQALPPTSGELVRLTEPNGGPIWISTNAVVAVRPAGGGGGSIIELGPNWSKSVKETNDVLIQLLNRA